MVRQQQRFGGRPKGGTQKQGRSDLPRRGGEPERIGEENEVSKVGWSDGRFHDALTSRANVPLESPNHFSRDVGRAVVRADLGDNVPKKVLRDMRWQQITS